MALATTVSVYERFGQRIVENTERQYQVKGGESLASIASAVYGIGYDSEAWRQIAEFNDIKDPDNLIAGQILLIPELQPKDRRALTPPNPVDVQGQLPALPKDSIGQDIALPFEVENGALRLVRGSDLVAQNLRILVLTQYNERPMMPGMGVGLRIGQPVNQLTRDRLLYQIREHIPEIDIDSVEIDITPESMHGDVELTITYRETGDVTERSLTFPDFKLQG